MSHCRHDHDRHVICAELEDYRKCNSIRKDRIDHIQLVTNIVRRHIDIHTLYEFKRDERYVFLGGRPDVLEVAHAVKRILKNLCDIGLDILRTGTRIRRHDHDHVRIKLREPVQRYINQRKNSEDHHGYEDQSRGDRIIYRFSIYVHSTTVILLP